MGPSFANVWWKPLHHFGDEADIKKETGKARVDALRDAARAYGGQPKHFQRRGSTATPATTEHASGSSNAGHCGTASPSSPGCSSVCSISSPAMATIHDVRLPGT